jgi:hypothetical protein
MSLSSRIRAALAHVPASSVFHAVLTFDRADWPSAQAAYAGMWRPWATLVQRLRRDVGSVAYVATVEAHRGADGWPHLHAILVSEGLVARARESGFKSWWKTRAVSAGYGYITSCEVARDAQAVAGYVAALAGGPLASEIAKTGQLPLQAPPHFRRVRSSQGFLPPARVSAGGWTGTIIRQRAEILEEYPPEALHGLALCTMGARGERPACTPPVWHAARAGPGL